MATEKSYNLETLNILIVEDNKHMQHLVKEILRALGVRTVRTANDGADGLKELQTFSADLLIVDWNMEVLDGLEFTRMVRTSSDVTNPYVPIIMLTGHTEHYRITDARDAGTSEYLAKPISPKRLYQRICQIVEKPRQFIRTGNYFGPDRRRTMPTEQSNRGRRSTDK